MNDLITRAVVGPKPVTLGSRTFLAWEARLSDLADLQAWIDRQQPSPLDGLAERLEGLAGSEADRVLFDAYAAAEEGPPSYDSEAGTERLCMPEGVAEFLRIALRRSVGEGWESDASPFGDELPTVDQFARLRRVFFGAGDLREITRMMKVPPFAGRGKALTWGEAIYSLVERYGWTPDYVAGLTITEFALARRGGKPENNDIRGDGETLKRLWERRQAAYGLAPAVEPRGTPISEPECDLEWVYPRKEGAD